MTRNFCAHVTLPGLGVVRIRLGDSTGWYSQPEVEDRPAIISPEDYERIGAVATAYMAGFDHGQVFNQHINQEKLP